MNPGKIFCFLFVSILILSCSDDDPMMMVVPEPEPEPEPVIPMVELSQNNTLGSILIDENGMTLYFFTKDAFDQSVCNDSCLDNWPIYYIEDLVIGSGLAASDFGTISRADGMNQTSYKGWPLYYFANDNAAGDINGEGANSVWFAAKPDYSIMLADNQLIGADGVSYTSSYEEGEEELQYFVDANGVTLYAFVIDRFDVNKYTKEDFSNDAIWPIYSSDSNVFPSTLDESLFNVISVHGQNQLTYKGWPLYYFGGDNMERGSNKGVSVPSPGIWPIVFQDIAEAEIDCMSTDISYKEDIEPILSESCAFVGCHGGDNPKAGLLLTDYDQVKTIADNGSLIGVISWADGFSRMPRNDDQLDACTIEKIQSWVDSGAEEN